MKKWKNFSRKTISFLFVVGVSIVPCVQAQNAKFDGIVDLIDDHRYTPIRNFKTRVLSVIEDQASMATLSECENFKKLLEDIKDEYLKPRKNSYIVRALDKITKEMEERGFIINEEVESDDASEDSDVTDDSNKEISSDEQESSEEEADVQTSDRDQDGGGDMFFEPEAPAVSQEPVSQEINDVIFNDETLGQLKLSQVTFSDVNALIAMIENDLVGIAKNVSVFEKEVRKNNASVQFDNENFEVKRKRFLSRNAFLIKTYNTIQDN